MAHGTDGTQLEGCPTPGGLWQPPAPSHYNVQLLTHMSSSPAGGTGSRTGKLGGPSKRNSACEGPFRRSSRLIRGPGKDSHLQDLIPGEHSAQSHPTTPQWGLPPAGEGFRLPGLPHPTLGHKRQTLVSRVRPPFSLKGISPPVPRGEVPFPLPQQRKALLAPFWVCGHPGCGRRWALIKYRRPGPASRDWALLATGRPGGFKVPQAIPECGQK